MSNQRPILFSTPMVQAIIEGRKTQTRRTKGLEFINSGKGAAKYRYDGPDDEDKLKHWFETCNMYGHPQEQYHFAICPYGQTGDILWVRELFYAYGHWIEVVKKNGKMGVKFVDETTLHGYNYRYFDNPPENVSKIRVWGSCRWYKRPSIHMPKAAARIWLKIVRDNAELLKDISEQSAINEGILFRQYGADKEYKDYMAKNTLDDPFGDTYYTQANLSFFSLWESINGLKSSDLNPWVWVISFDRINLINGENISAAQAILFAEDSIKKVSKP